ncbi:Protein of unknown function (DUF501) [Seminavis robusta]|uniref:Uncharacterized protein n=1 Tax=Seminavis robusta TaxID=568900 RepID=A0A9N8EKR1_9STRA|nr:Protein of unknown function (DUF501) [Seminavis robusta]|eukprot:Sro1088_g240000.1 Protein of unknown function (DUF501) (269) ;mRNA; r:19044-19978
MTQSSDRLPTCGYRIFLLTILCLVLSPADALVLLSSTAVSSASSSSLDDKTVVERQLGYLPPNYLHVSARTRHGSPIAIKTYPILRKKKGYDSAQIPLDPSSPKSSWGVPFPTNYWLTCPAISRAIGEIERLGYIGLIVDYLNLEEPANFDKRQQLLRCHQQCGEDRWETLEPSDRDFFQQYAESDPTIANMKFMIQESGISGLEYQSKLDAGFLTEVSIKCLHTHYAHFCSTTTPEQRFSSSTTLLENPIGRITHNLLRSKFPSLEL